MRLITAVALFCEDIREEQQGTSTIVGVLPDNLSVGSGPGFLPKLAIYLRIQIDHAVTVSTIRARIIFSDGRELEMAPFDLGSFEAAKKESIQNSIPYTGLVAKAIISPVSIQESGRIEVIMAVNGEEFVCGMLRLIISDPAPSGS
jgi:hypothetical protein